jgi:hypothetical protein
MLSDRASRPDVAKYCTIEIIAWVREIEPLWARLCSTGVFVGMRTGELTSLRARLCSTGAFVGARTGVANPARLNIEAFPFGI